MPELPPQASAAKYLAVYDISGVSQVLELPTTRGVVGWDGTNLRFLDGSDSQPLILPELEEVEGGDHPYIAIVRPTGQVMKLKVPDAFAGRAALEADSGNVHWVAKEDDDRAIPESGTGLLLVDGDGVKLIGTANTKQLIYWNGNTAQTLTIPSGNGKVIQTVNGDITFADPVSTSAIGGVQGFGLEFVTAKNTNASTVTLTAPVMVLKDVDDDSLVTVDNVNVTASLAASDGVGGVDDGGAQNSRFYHMWVVNDGSNTDLILSESLTAPDLSNAAGYTKQAYAGSFYVESDGQIRDFLQQGTDVEVEEKEWGTNLAITTNFVSIVGAVNLNTLIPSTAVYARGHAGGSSAETGSRAIQVATDTNGLGKRWVGDVAALKNADGTVTGINFDSFKFHVGAFEVAITNPLSPVITWRASAAASGKQRITINGYKLRG
jgi:hypothetical protein